jgi:hypothetical protein
MSNKKTGPRVLIFDIETSPIEARVWGLWDQNIGLNQIIKDWTVLSWSAKWLGDSPDKVMYQDTRNQKDIRNDKKLLKKMHALLDEADIVITQNGIRFDQKKLNARFVLNGFTPPSPYKHIDICVISQTVFGFTSNKLEYLTDKLCTKYKKQKHKKYPGMELWNACLDNKQDAWEEMETYNKYDVLSLEELYYIVSPWKKSIQFSLYHDGDDYVCNCGGDKFERRGFSYTTTGKYQRFRCKKCGAWSRGAENLLDKDKRKSLHRKI